MSDAGRLWEACERQLREQVNEATWQPWFSGIRAEALDDGTLTLAVPSSVVRDRIESRYLSLIRGALADVAGPDLDVHLVVRTTPSQHAFNFSAPGAATSGPPATSGPGYTDQLAPARATLDVASSGPPTYGDNHAHAPRADPSPEDDTAGNLDHRFTFNQFVIGESNRFAHAAAMAVAESPARSYNPLFIYGDSGLGKTHLIRAIGNYVRDNFPLKTVCYVTTETFLTEFVDSIRTGSQNAFKRRYRDADVLLVDDVQFLEGKKETQDEFFHTFNHLYNLNKQIVLTSDRHPSGIATLEARLQGRFLSGLITDVQPPELETRLAILRRKAEDVRVLVPDEVLVLIASNVKDNIRELEGALTRVTAFATLNAIHLTLEVAEIVLKDLIQDGIPRPPTIRQIIEATSIEFDISVEDLTGQSRRKNLVDARQISMYVCRQLTDESYPSIARAFGGRDHTTVIYAVDKITRLMGERPIYYDKVTRLIDKSRQDR